MKVKNWSKFQHFKDRKPPWIKLYREVLDDIDWFELSGDDAKTLISLWLIASEDENKEGNLPNVRSLAFRLRVSEADLMSSITRLNKWLTQDDIKPISSRYQDATPETETETETETDFPPTLNNNMASGVVLREGRFFDDVTGEEITTPFDEVHQ